MELFFDSIFGLIVPVYYDLSL